MSPLRVGNGEYPNTAVIATAIIHTPTPFLLDNNSDDFFIEDPQAIAMINPRIKTIAPRISMSIFHNVKVKKLNKSITIPIPHNQIPFFLESRFIF